MKEKLKQLTKIKKGPVKKSDWFGIAIFASAALIVAFVVLIQINDAYTQKVEGDMQMAQSREQEVLINRMRPDMWKEPPVTDSTPEKTYEAVRQALLDEDLDTVLFYIHPAFRWKFEDTLRERRADGMLPEAGERMTSIKGLIDEYGLEYGGTKIYELEPVPGEEHIENALERSTNRVEFTMDSDGIWKISSI